MPAMHAIQGDGYADLQDERILPQADADYVLRIIDVAAALKLPAGRTLR
jgi:hypothetical protein